MIPYEKWPDPKVVSEGEYSVIHDFIGGVRADNKDSPEREDIVEGCLINIIAWSEMLLELGVTRDDLG